MTTETKAIDSTTANDEWKDTAKVYSDQVSSMTRMHASDLLAILKDDILKAKTVLDVGSGTGAFGHAYLQYFPNGIPNQTLILSDLSNGMLDQAKASLKIPADYQTKILFQQEDATNLEGIESDSIDVVISTFGVFLIPDQEATLASIQRVMKAHAVFGNASWVDTGLEELGKLGYGVTLQQAFAAPVKTIDPGFYDRDGLACKKWAEANEIQRMLTEDYKFGSCKVFRTLHTTVWDFDGLWGTIAENPMANVKDASKEDYDRAYQAFTDCVTQNGVHSTEDPFMFSSASNLAVARGLPS
jgi:ubiquinone/menaquinone biosynthesis C-methylase UbiE